MPAFVLATFASVASFALDHIFAFGGAGLVGVAIACVVLEVFVPGSIPLIRTALGVVMKGLQWLIGTTAGAFVLVAIGCFFLGFWANTFLDRSIALQRKLEAQVEATKAAEAVAAQARAAALALNTINAAATRRADAAEDEAADERDQVSDLASQLVANDKAAAAAKKPARSFALSSSDIAELARIGAPRAAKH